jgi:hypothetical protein
VLRYTLKGAVGVFVQCRFPNRDEIHDDHELSPGEISYKTLSQVFLRGHASGSHSAADHALSHHEHLLRIWQHVFRLGERASCAVLFLRNTARGGDLCLLYSS